MAIVGYARVSAQDQDITTQIEKLRAAGAERVYAEKRSGTSLAGRSEFESLMAFVREGDEVITTRIDRCARSMADFQGIVSAWKAKGVRYRAIEQAGVALDGSSTSDLFLNLLMAFAEFETRLRRERQLDGIAAKKAADQSKPKHERTYSGRPQSIDVESVLRLRKLENLGATAIAKRLGISRASVYRLLNQRAPNVNQTEVRAG